MLDASVGGLKQSHYNNAILHSPPVPATPTTVSKLYLLII
jgi:hypothetical protein